MKRKSSKLLIPIALVGAAATGFLVVMLMGEGDARHERSRDRADPDGRGSANRSGGGTDTVANGSGSDSRAKSLYNTVYPGQRQAHDSPMTVQDRRVAQNRVEELIQSIMLAEDTNSRIQIKNELVALMRRLGRHIDPVIRDRLISMIDTVEPRWRPLVGHALGQLHGDETVANALLAKLKERPENYHTRRAIYEAFNNLNVKSILPGLVAMLGDGHEDEPRLVATIGHLGGPDEARLLLERLGQPLRAATRFEIERVLKTKSGYPGFMNDVIERMEDADTLTRRSLLKVLERSRDPAHAEAVRDLLKNEGDPEVRRTAISVLGSFGDTDSGQALLRIIERGEERERKLAANAIANIRDSQTVGALADGYDGLGQDARWALIRAGSRVPQPSEKLFEIARRDGLSDARMGIRVASATMLGRPGKDENVEALAGFLGRAKHPSEWTQGLRALERIGTKKAADLALSSLHVVHNPQQREHWTKKFEKLHEKHRRSEALREAGTRDR